MGHEPHAAPSGEIDPGVLDPNVLMAQAGSENFPVALRLLNPDHRRHLLAVYGYARLVDDIGDEAAGDRTAQLNTLEADLRTLYDGHQPELEILRRLAPTVREVPLPIEPLLDLIEANRQDQTVHRYATYDDLLHYCTLSANPVGRLVLHIFGAATPDRIALSDDICTALQIAEHLQDVAEDYGNGRVYLPQEDLARFGVAETDLAAARAGLPLRRLVAFESLRARRLLDRGVPLVATLTGRERLALAGFTAGGRAALDAVEAAGNDVLGLHPRPAKGRLLAHAVRVLVRKK